MASCDNSSEKSTDVLLEIDPLVCSICIEPLSSDEIEILEVCLHQVHKECINKWKMYLTEKTKVKTFDCPLCRTPIERIERVEAERIQSTIDVEMPSTAGVPSRTTNQSEEGQLQFMIHGFLKLSLVLAMFAVCVTLVFMFKRQIEQNDSQDDG
jgi:tetrahydromethanopterin S-methyltransferase subunit B